MDCRKRAQYNLTIMQQIGELKNWHQQQQQIIKQPRAESKNNRQNRFVLPADTDTEQDLSDTDKKQCQARFEHKISETQETIQCGTVASKKDTTGKDNINFDELPIHTTNTDFNKLVENSMKTTKLDKTTSVQTTKHKFLKKGEGTARFGMLLPKPGKKNSVNHEKIVLCNKPQNFHKSEVMKYISDTSCTKVETDFLENNKNCVTPPKSPEQTKANGTSWRSVLKSSPQMSKSSDNIQINDSVMLSFIEKILSLDEANTKECEELKIFELLEQRVLDTSFSSNSSILTRLMENSVKSTPVKGKLLSDTISGDTKCVSNSSKHDESTINTNVHVLVDNSCDFINNSKIKKHEEPCNILPADSNDSEEEQASPLYSNKLSSNNNDIDKSLHVHFAENDSFTSFKNDKYCSSDECTEMPKDSSQLTRQKGSVFFDDYEEWSCGDCTCENNTEFNSSEYCRAISPPSLLSQTNHSVTSVNGKILCENMLKIKESKDSDYGIYYVSKNNATNKDTSNSSCDIHTTELKSVDASIKTDDVIRRSVIEARLKELETEIETFRLENNKLKKLRTEYDQEYKKFKNEKKNFLKHLNEEKNRIAADLEEEKKKLAKEKQVFEKYSKTVSKNPSKQERAEILALKQKLTELQEEMKKKESRWGASQARVRNQVRQLEEDNKRLKDEIEHIKKMSTCNHCNSGNSQIQEYPVSNTQLIHIINKQLSNLGYLPNFEEDSLHLSKQIKINTCRKIVDQNKKTKEFKKASKAAIKLDGCAESKLKNSNTHTHSDGENSVKQTVYTEANKQFVESENSVSNADNHILQDETYKNITELYDCFQDVGGENEEITRDSEAVKEIIIPDGKEIIKEMIFPDGRKELYYPNGNIKKISPSGDVTKMIYFNGDVKETNKDGTVKYYYAESKVWHTTYSDGLEVLDYPNGLVEERCKNGSVNVTYPNGSKKHIYTDNSEEWIYPDGSTMKVNLNNDKILTLPNGQKEIHTKEHMRREYPDGTIKFVYPDGTQETRYSNGRIRLKDKSGNLVMDSG